MIRYVANLVAAGYCPGQDNFKKLNELEQSVILQVSNIREKFGRDSWETAERLKKAGGKMFVSYVERGIGNVHDYIRFLEWNKDAIQVCNERHMYTGIAYADDGQQAWNALHYLESRGFSPIPIYHFGNDVRLLRHYCEEYSDVVIVAPDGSPRYQVSAFDHLWTNYILREDFKVKARMHALELSAPTIISRYPWHSYDNADWVRLANSGDIITDDGKSICVGQNESKMLSGKHLLTLSDIEGAEVHRQIRESGFDTERLFANKESRAAYNIYKILQSKNSRPNIKVQAKPMIQGLF